MIPRPPNPAVAMKLSHHRSSLSPPALKLLRTIPIRVTNRHFLHISISPAARQRPVSRALPHSLLRRSPLAFATAPSRSASTTSSTSARADVLIEQITDLYSTARDEFEIAAEETEKKSTYGPEDREAAHEAFEELKGVYDEAISGKEGEEVGREVEKRVGGRIRELENALKNMDELALED